MAGRRPQACDGSSPRWTFMHREQLRKRTPDTESSGISHGLLFSFLLLLVVVLFSTRAIAAPARGQTPAGAKVSQTAPATGDFVGQEVCATCHEEAAKGFASNPHTKMAEMHGKTGVTCEGCHGPGKAHVDGGGDVTKIFNPGQGHCQGSRRKVPDLPRGQHANFERSAHGEEQCELRRAATAFMLAKTRSSCSRSPSPGSASSATPISSRSSPCLSTTRWKRAC